MNRFFVQTSRAATRAVPRQVVGRVMTAQFSHHTEKEPFLNKVDVAARIVELVRMMEKVDATKVTNEARFKEDLDLDSLDAVEVVMAVEDEFCIEIPDSEADKILSIPDAVSYVSMHPMAKKTTELIL